MTLSKDHVLDLLEATFPRLKWEVTKTGYGHQVMVDIWALRLRVQIYAEDTGFKFHDGTRTYQAGDVYLTLEGVPVPPVGFNTPALLWTAGPLRKRGYEDTASPNPRYVRVITTVPELEAALSQLRMELTSLGVALIHVCEQTGTLPPESSQAIEQFLTKRGTAQEPEEIMVEEVLDAITSRKPVVHEIDDSEDLFEALFGID